MPRVYRPDPRGKRHLKPNVEDLEQALDDIEKKNWSVRKAAANRNINYSVVYRALVKKRKGEERLSLGGQTSLLAEEEEHIVQCIETASLWGYPIDAFDLHMIVHDYLEETGQTVAKFRNNIPGRDFAYSFVKRHKNRISSRMCQNIKRNRASVSPRMINSYFDELSIRLENIPPSHIVNYDETNLSDDPGRKKVLCKRGLKYPERIINSSKSATSIMFAASACGTLLPTYVVYKSKHLYDTWTRNGLAGTRYNRTESGWFDSLCFHDWLQNIALPYFRKLDGKKILIGDNLSSHLSCQAVRLCEEYNIHFVFLPPNSTHMTQPLDISFFRPLKEAWRSILTKWKLGPGIKESTVPKGMFPNLLKQLHEKVLSNSIENIKNGFWKAGIIPLNQNEVLSRLPKPSPNPDGNVQEQIETSFETFLKTLRYGVENNAAPKQRAKKRLNIEPGKSVQGADFEPNGAPLTEPETNKWKRRQAGPAPRQSDDYNLSDLEDDPDDELIPVSTGLEINKPEEDPVDEPVLGSNDTNISNPEDNPASEFMPQLINMDIDAVRNEQGPSGLAPSEPEPEFSIEDFASGMFVVVKYTFEVSSSKPHQNRFYVGQILEKYANRLQIRFLRPYKCRRTAFHFLDSDRREDDIEIVKLDTIEKILPEPKERRGIYHFPDNCY